MVNIIKANGEKQKYDPKKIKRSLERAGASEQTIKEVLRQVEKEIYEGMLTRDLYRLVFRGYKKYEPLTSSRYGLKAALEKLGKTTGLHFEAFIARMLQLQGYQTQLNRTVPGKRITHEIDITASKGKETLMVECKHHTKSWIECNVQIALYVYARFLDVQKQFTRPMIVTNTRFSKQAIDYAQGVNMQLWGWRYPEKEGLEIFLESQRLYPITLLQTLDEKTTDQCLNQRLVLVPDLFDFSEQELAQKLRISLQKAKKIVEEAHAVCEKR